MTDAEIKNLRDLLRAATPGPLTVMARNHGEQCVAVVNNLELVPPYGVELAHEKADADFLVAAVNALPSLLDEVERLRADAARLDHIEKHARYDPKIDGNHAWWPTTFENVLRGPTLRAAIDAAAEEESGEQSTSSFENFMEIPDGGR